MHNERCRDCKDSVIKMLAALFGTIYKNWDLDLPCRLNDYANSNLFGTLRGVHKALQGYRGFDQFVKSRKLQRVDFFVPDQKLIVEFDEAQHFTMPRDISLSLYPHIIDYGFPIQRWRTLCRELNKQDNDPPYRDEQRAWYDTLRDIVPQYSGFGQTVRLYSRDLLWCELNPKSKSDLLIFQQLIMKRRAGQ